MKAVTKNHEVNVLVMRKDWWRRPEFCSRELLDCKTGRGSDNLICMSCFTSAVLCMAQGEGIGSRRICKYRL